MRIQSKSIKFMQQGGPAPAPQDAPAAAPAEGAPVEGGAPEGGAQDPMQQILQVAAQAVQTRNGAWRSSSRGTNIRKKWF